MKTMCPYTEEDLPPDIPSPLGASIQINAFVYEKHEGDQKTRQYQTGIIIYGNMAPLFWYSKRKKTDEASTFGFEFISMRILFQMIIALCYKLQMFVIKVNGPCNVFSDNEAVMKSTMVAESTLKKKHFSIAYHKSREAVTAGVILVFFTRNQDPIMLTFSLKF